MSLVNDMLRDLDKRSDLPEKAQRINRMISGRDDAGSGLSPLAIGGLLALCLLAGIGGGYVLFGGDSASPVIEPALPIEQAVAASAEPEAQAVASPQAVNIVISEEDIDAGGFTLGINARDEVRYTVIERSSRGLTLQFDNAVSFERDENSLSGISVIQTSDNIQLELALDREADFDVLKVDGDENFELLLSARYRRAQPSTMTARTGSEDAVTGATTGAANVARSPAASVAAQPVVRAAPEPATATPGDSQPAQSESTAMAAASPKGAPLRINRTMTFEQQDRNKSREAVDLVAAGRVQAAYEVLVPFVEQQPQAHVSRHTLATILVSQNELEFANLVIDKGLELAPNHAPFKKIKARLLINAGQAQAALSLMAQVVPALASDTEYHEILANLYQQTGRHDQAVTTYQELLRFNRQEGRWWAGLAISLEGQGNTGQALASYQAALQAGNLDARLRRHAQERVNTLGQQ